MLVILLLACASSRVCGRALRVKCAAPGREYPTADADTDHWRLISVQAALSSSSAKADDPVIAGIEMGHFTALWDVWRLLDAPLSRGMTTETSPFAMLHGTARSPTCTPARRDRAPAR